MVDDIKGCCIAVIFTHSLGRHSSMKVLLAISLLLHQVAGHARLIEPPSRSSMWRFGFANPPDYTDNQGFCGGINHQFGDMGGKCGICGDAYDDLPRQHEAPNGRYANGILVRSYHPGQTLQVIIEVTANHNGYFYFKMCPNNNVHQDPQQECFDKYPLKVFNDHGEIMEKYELPDQKTRKFPVQVQLPQDLQCHQCILQWTYVAGNNWGTNSDGHTCIGCGAQEHFRACSDISILDSAESQAVHLPTLNPPTLQPPNPQQPAVRKYKGVVTCTALSPYDAQGLDEWCTNNCNMGNCPSNMCTCQPA